MLKNNQSGFNHYLCFYGSLVVTKNMDWRILESQRLRSICSRRVLVDWRDYRASYIVGRIFIINTVDVSSQYLVDGN
jgi:hypothetical protein